MSAESVAEFYDAAEQIESSSDESEVVMSSRYVYCVHNSWVVILVSKRNIDF